MKKLLLVFIVLFSLSAQSQTYTYKPLNLDTSSFWVLNYQWGGIGSFNIERIVYKEKDTVINNVIYSKLMAYTSVPSNSQNLFAAAMNYNNEKVYFLREDTIAKKVFMGNAVVLDFSVMLGDSLLDSPIDSISYAPYPYNITRRTIFASSWNIGSYKLIEGIGANINFPETSWGPTTPSFSCKCYSKGGKTLYREWGNSDSCIKKPVATFWPASIYENNKTNTTLTFTNNQLKVSLFKLEQCQIQISDISGRTILKENIEHLSYSKDLSAMPNGIYLINIKSKNQRTTKKVLVQ